VIFPSHFAARVDFYVKFGRILPFQTGMI